MNAASGGSPEAAGATSSAVPTGRSADTAGVVSKDCPRSGPDPCGPGSAWIRPRQRMQPLDRAVCHRKLTSCSTLTPPKCRFTSFRLRLAATGVPSYRIIARITTRSVTTARDRRRIGNEIVNDLERALPAADYGAIWGARSTWRECPHRGSIRAAEPDAVAGHAVVGGISRVGAASE